MAWKIRSCPNCRELARYDGERCRKCGFIRKLEDQEELLNLIMSLFDPITYNLRELYLNPDQIPDVSGIYAWYFDDYFFSDTEGMVFPDLPNISFVHIFSIFDEVIAIDINKNSSWYLMYIGIAGEKKGRTLRDRIYGEHLKQNTTGSTLRFTLAALLHENLGLKPEKQLKTKEEKNILNQWLFEHAKIAWVETDDPGKLEKIMLSEFGEQLYFNLKENSQNEHLAKIKKLREEWKAGGANLISKIFGKAQQDFETDE